MPKHMEAFSVAADRQIMHELFARCYKSNRLAKYF